ncbi:MAG: hypothetical protein JSS27_04240 [Planctomycetes bacterium]|nr:hypothetical protein [Planctomycetota bacterium]
MSRDRAPALPWLPIVGLGALFLSALANRDPGVLTRRESATGALAPKVSTAAVKTAIAARGRPANAEALVTRETSQVVVEAIVLAPEPKITGPINTAPMIAPPPADAAPIVDPFLIGMIEPATTAPAVAASPAVVSLASQDVLSPIEPPTPAQTVTPAIAPTEPSPPAVEPQGEVKLALVPARTPNAMPAPEAAKKETTSPQRPGAPALTAAPIHTGWWPVPTELIEHLDRLDTYPECRAWSEQVRRRVNALVATNDPHALQVNELLDELEELAGQLNVILPQMPEQPGTVALRRGGVALMRRLDVWQQIPHLAAASKIETAAAPESLEEFAIALNEIEKLPDDAIGGSEVRNQLLLGRLRELTQRPNRDEPARHRVAATVLSRLDRLGVSSRTMPNDGKRHPLIALHAGLRHWVNRPVDTQQMLNHLEEFERSGLPSDARVVADDYHRLCWASGASEQQLATAMATHYRNANLRISISADLLNRMIIPQAPREQRLNEVVLGRPTTGHSTTWTDVKVRLVPDLQRVRMNFEAHGRISADTVTKATMVRVHSHSDSMFKATKELQIDHDGMRTLPTQTSAETYPQFQGAETDVDAVPLFGPLLQTLAESQFDSQQAKVRGESARKIARRVCDEMDTELATRVDRLTGAVRASMLDSLHQLELSPELIDAQTSADRIAMRVRVSGDHQLAGHGPRPRAPGDSLASVQIHQSLLNNICDQLHWEGKTYSLPELRADITKRFGKRFNVVSADEHQELQITFAQEDPVRIQCRDGIIEFSMAIDRLKLHKDSWRNFVVKVRYQPDLSGDQGRLEREGTIQLVGQGLGPRAQITLRTIFSKAFSPAKQVPILPAAFAERPGLADLRVTQFEIRDEWIGLALNTPERIAQRNQFQLK